MPDKGKAGNLSKNLETVREARDKVHAHNEALEKAVRKLPTWAGVESLVDYAKDFTCLISFGFLNLYLGKNSQDYMLHTDARRLSSKMEEVIVLANLNKAI